MKSYTPTKFPILNHGNLIGVSRLAIGSHSWKAELVKQNNLTGEGTLILSCREGSTRVSIPYHLPEDPDEITSTVRSAIKADQVELDRQSSGSKKT